jgi:peptidoglycan/LPS O-acetylase OafA/YrhL
MMKEKIYFPNLDGLRFFSFLAVLLSHATTYDIEPIKFNPVYQFIKEGIFRSASQGVNFFFVLSGFLITYLLLKEKELHGSINIIYFYYIYPCYNV